MAVEFFQLIARFAWRKSFRTSKSISFHNSANCGNAILIVHFPARFAIFLFNVRCFDLPGNVCTVVYHRSKTNKTRNLDLSTWSNMFGTYRKMLLTNRLNSDFQCRLDPHVTQSLTDNLVRKDFRREYLV